MSDQLERVPIEAGQIRRRRADPNLFYLVLLNNKNEFVKAWLPDYRVSETSGPKEIDPVVCNLQEATASLKNSLP